VLTLADVRGGQRLALEQLRLEGLDARPVQGPSRLASPAGTPVGRRGPVDSGWGVRTPP
jgi:hypothetical protein